MKWLIWLMLGVCLQGVIMAKKRSLTRYVEKRDFTVTPEPKGKTAKKAKGPIFVVQKHDATRLHYDVRLEIDGVLTSWAVPKGPSYNPEIKRLAVMTEDHPMDYANFEGVIPEGQYGAGPVMVWDTGTYRNIKEHDGKLLSMSECLEKGQVEVVLEGFKLHGGFALIRTQYQDKDNQWLMIKMNDEFASRKKNPVSTKNKSVLTDRTLAQIKKEG